MPQKACRKNLLTANQISKKLARQSAKHSSTQQLRKPLQKILPRELHASALQRGGFRIVRVSNDLHMTPDYLLPRVKKY